MDSTQAAPNDAEDGEGDLEVDMSWHLARYLPETRGLRAKFQTLIAGFLLATKKAVDAEAKRLIECGVTISQEAAVAVGLVER